MTIGEFCNSHYCFSYAFSTHVKGPENLRFLALFLDGFSNASPFKLEFFFEHLQHPA